MTNQALETAVKALIKQEKVIEAIQLVQNTLHCGLKKAKDYVDKLI